VAISAPPRSEPTRLPVSQFQRHCARQSVSEGLARLRVPHWSIRTIAIEQTTSGCGGVPVTLGVRHYRQRAAAPSAVCVDPAAQGNVCGLARGDEVRLPSGWRTSSTPARSTSPTTSSCRSLDAGPCTPWAGNRNVPRPRRHGDWRSALHVGEGPMSHDFDGFNRIDLSGISIAAGLAIRQ